MNEPDDDLDPRQLILQHYGSLEGAVSPLAQLMKVNPRLAEEIIRFAMVCGIHAEQTRVALDAQREMLLKIKSGMGDRWTGFQ